SRVGSRHSHVPCPREHIFLVAAYAAAKEKGDSGSGVKQTAFSMVVAGSIPVLYGELSTRTVGNSVVGTSLDERLPPAYSNFGEGVGVPKYVQPALWAIPSSARGNSNVKSSPGKFNHSAVRERFCFKRGKRIRYFLECCNWRGVCGSRIVACFAHLGCWNRLIGDFAVVVQRCLGIGS